MNTLHIHDVLLSLSSVVDLMNPALNEHHRHVAYIAYRIATAFGYDTMRVADVVLAAMLHDIGAFSEQERLNLLVFEDDAYAQVDIHAEVGYRLLKAFAPLVTAASYIRFHHKSWQPTKSKHNQDIDIPLGSHILHLADRIAVLIRKDQDILVQTKNIQTRIAEHTGVFMPELVAVFNDLASKEEFWLSTLYERIDEEFCNRLGLASIPLSSHQFEALVDMFRRIIDFRSKFTAMHSCGVATTASTVAAIVGFSPEDVRMMRLAGNLHDLGKIAIPSEILEKPSALTTREMSIMRTHPYHTDRILKPMPCLNTVRIWGSQHHERINGEGYPFHVHEEELPLGSRIMMVADIFTALTEDRPYRKGMLLDDALNIMKRMLERGLDPEIYSVVCNNAIDINQARAVTQQASSLEYQQFVQTTVSHCSPIY